MKFFMGDRKEHAEYQEYHEKDNEILTKNNKIYFYKSIEDSSICELKRLIAEKSEESILAQFRLSLPEPPPIHLHIQSYGGLIFSGFAGMEAIRNNQVPIYTFIDGVAASAATFLSIVGKKRFMYENSYVLIHQISSDCGGTYENIKDAMKNSDMLTQKLLSMYKQYCSFDDSVLTELLKHDLYLSSQECLDYCIVDEII